MSEPGAQTFKTIAAVLASLAGLVAYVYAVGGLVLIARLHESHLPAMPTVTQLSREQLIGTGLLEVVGPMILFALVAVVGAGVQLHGDSPADHVVGLVVTVGIFLLTVAFATKPAAITWALATAVAYASGILVARMDRELLENWATFLLVAIGLGLVGSAARLYFDSRNTAFPPAAVCVTDKDGKGIKTERGLLVGRTDSTLFLGKSRHVLALASVSNVIVGGDVSKADACALTLGP